MLTRLFLAFALVLPAAGAHAAKLGEDGLHKEDWFAITFRDIREDMADAAAQGKRLALIFEQRGCIYCKKVHEEVLSDPQVRDYIKANYLVVQYNLYGDEEVVDLDGETLTEKTAGRKWGIVFTPTILFMPETAGEELSASQAAVAAMPGAFRKGTFLDMFTWVREKRYQTDEDFQRFHARRIREREAAGVQNTD
ncbi:thioredoxin family protein [Minwuia thermotolerans]|uniref:Thioredoxin n=1 Tax=Minwuia thermotolerans TaxID=2056226 RepID=A0A2M9G3A0_9PROT|nr:thioredoxin family protein [Minwuia thermotolerans]PJK30185.1 thioredoxin [Minwuia thermotolerans]